MARQVENEKFLKARRKQERFALVFSNLALVFVLFMPGQSFPWTAKVGFVCGLLLLDVLFCLVQVKFHGDSAALKKDRTYHTLYYVAWGMVGVAIFLVILNTFGLFRKGPEFALYTYAWEEEALEESLADVPEETEAGLSVTALHPVDSQEELSALLASLNGDPDEEEQETIALILHDFPESYFADKTLYLAAISSGMQQGQIAADADRESTETGAEGIATVYFHPGEAAKEEHRYLFFLKLSRTEAASYGGWTLKTAAN